MKSSSRKTRSGAGSIYKDESKSDLADSGSDSEFEPTTDSDSESEEAESSEEGDEGEEDSEEEYNPFGGSDSDDGEDAFSCILLYFLTLIYL